MSSTRSKVHPRYKTQYRVKNWAEYEGGLVRRGDVTVWISESATRAWRAAPTGRRGAQPKFSDLAIETALTVRLVFNLPLRQTEGFLQSLLGLMELDLSGPDHTTLSRRSRALSTRLARIPSVGPIHLVVDSSGLAVHGEGEWAAARRGGNARRGWRKLHLGVDESGVIVAQVMSGGSANDADVGPSLIKQSGAALQSFVADAAYDAGTVYRAAMSRGARVVVPPVRAAVVRRCKSKWRSARNSIVARVCEVGRRQWKKEAGYHRQARAENAFFRYKTILGDRLRARHRDGQAVEVRMACDILNRMTALGRPESFAVRAMVG